MPPAGKYQPADVPAKGYWQSPFQTYDALRTTWRKLENEKVDLEELINKKQVSYFNRVRKSDKLSEYDRAFHCFQEFDPKKQREDRQNIDIIRNRIFNEETCISKSSCNSITSCSEETREQLEFISEQEDFIKQRKRIGPRFLPRGTPVNASKASV